MIKNKIAGALYGFAIGDAMGATTEFMSENKIKETFGNVTDILGGGWLNLKAGEVTDDTQMSMCVMDALMKGKKHFKMHCAENFVDWYKSGPKDIGGQCQRAIQHFMYTGQYIYKDSEALGNGSLMRALPCAVLNNEKLNIEQGLITHNNSECSRGIQIYTRLIQNYLNDNCNKLYSYNIKSLLKPSGCIYNTLNNAIYWSNKSTFYEAIIGAVNHGGDADTIAAITGGLAGAKFGYNNIPQKWIDQLNCDVKIFLEKFKNFAFTYVQI